MTTSNVHKEGQRTIKSQLETQILLADGFVFLSKRKDRGTMYVKHRSQKKSRRRKKAELDTTVSASFAGSETHIHEKCRF